MHKYLVALVLGAVVALGAGCGTTVDHSPNNAAAAPFNGTEVSPVYGATGGPRVPGAGAPGTQASATPPPDATQLEASLLGKEDLPEDASAYRNPTVGGWPPCLQPVLAPTGSAGRAAKAYYQSASTAPGANAYPGAVSGTPTNPLVLFEYLQSFPAAQVRAAYQRDAEAIAKCKPLKHFSLTLNGSPLAVSGIGESSSAPFGSPSTDFLGSVSYRGAQLQGVMAVGVIGDVVAMVAYLTPGPPDPSTLTEYTQKAQSDINLHLHS